MDLRWRIMVWIIMAALVTSPQYEQIASGGEHSRPGRSRLCPPGEVAPAAPVPAKPAPPAVQPAPPTEVPFEQFAATSDPTVALVDAHGGYLDNAVIRSRMRLRFDQATGLQFPDRAEYFYPKCGCFPDGRGPAIPEPLLGGGIDYQDYLAYVEFAPRDWLSGFIEMGVRSINPELNPNSTGMGDLQAGVKAYLLQGSDRQLTFQLKGYFPTGDGDRGLGTEHTSIEPGLLYHQRLSDRLGIMAELKDWTTAGATNFGGNVLQYGAGASYDLFARDQTLVTPVFETVGWTVLRGFETSPNAPGFARDAEGDTIVNVKIGARLTVGRASLYAGYGHAVSGRKWYQDIARIEYRLDF